MDALSDVLKVAHLTGGVFLHADFFAPWCMSARVPPEQCQPALGPASHLILYHYVVEGALRIRIENENREDLVGLRCGAATSSIPPKTAACSPYTMGAAADARGWSAGFSAALVPWTIR